MSMQSVCTKRLRNIADNLNANGYTDSAFEVKHAADTIDELRGMCADLYDHVDELKALAQRLYYCGQRDRECDRCGMNGADMHVKMSDVDYCDGINMCIRDLGVEVDK